MLILFTDIRGVYIVQKLTINTCQPFETLFLKRVRRKQVSPNQVGLDIKARWSDDILPENVCINGRFEKDG